MGELLIVTLLFWTFPRRAVVRLCTATLMDTGESIIKYFKVCAALFVMWLAAGLSFIFKLDHYHIFRSFQHNTLPTNFCCAWHQSYLLPGTGIMQPCYYPSHVENNLSYICYVPNK